MVTSEKPAPLLKDFFPSGMEEAEKEGMMAVPLPLGMVLGIPKDRTRKTGMQFCATWIKSDKEVKKVNVVYGKDGRLDYVAVDHYVYPV